MGFFSKSVKVSCIIPAYNEEDTIVGVVKTALATPEIGEVIVVDDGSTDKTAALVGQLRSRRLRLVRLEKNQGKGAALMAGVRLSRWPVLLFLDGDLINLEPHHLSSLIWPVVDGRVEMAIADPFAKLKLSLQLVVQPVLWYFSGQRCLLKEPLLPHLEEIATSRYAVELWLNEIFAEKRVVVIPWFSPRPLHRLKSKKLADWRANYLREAIEIAQKILASSSSRYRHRLQKRLAELLEKMP